MKEQISNISFLSEFQSKYQKGVELTYEINGETRVEEFNVKMGSVSVLLFDCKKQIFLLVRQFRPAIFVSHVKNLPENINKDYNEINWNEYDPEIGFTMELCAGLIDKNGLTPEQIACEEIVEECGYKIDIDNLIPITTFLVGAHQSGSAQHMYYAEIEDSMKVSEGGGNNHEGEFITKVYLTLDEAKSILYPIDGGYTDVKGPPGVLFALKWWFLRNRNSTNCLISNADRNIKWCPDNVRKISNILFSQGFDNLKYGYNPKRMLFTHNGIKRFWDMALFPNSAACIIVDSKCREIILGQRFRAQVLIGRSRFIANNLGKSLDEIKFENTDHNWAYILELPTCVVPSMEFAKSKMVSSIRDFGYEVNEETLKLFARVLTGIGQSGDTQYIFMADIKQSKKLASTNIADMKEVRIPFQNIPSLLSQPLMGPPNVYYAFGVVIDMIDRNIL